LILWEVSFLAEEWCQKTRVYTKLSEETIYILKKIDYIYNQKKIMKEINDENFQETIQSNQIAVIDFWAQWCPPCVKLLPVMEKLSEENPNVLIGKANVVLNEKTTSEFGIKSIPTVLFFKDGQLVDRTMGFQTQQELQEKINSFL